MGWPWSSPTTPKANVCQKEPIAEQNELRQSSSQISTRQGIAESKIIDFLSDIPDGTSTEDISKKELEPTPHTQSNMSSQPAHESISEHLLPTTMSCRDAFDSAFYCNSLGGAFNHLYRYGSVRSCSEHWDKFWFCMRTRTYGEESKKNAIKEYYRTVERTKYGKRGSSSEDVWKSRDQLVRKNTAFRTDEEEWNGSDEEWRKAILEMRKRMFEAAGSCRR